MSKHTPGPWQAEHHKFNNGKELYYINGPNGALGYPVLVAQVGNNEADAQLIASAPTLQAQNRDLLTALEAALAHGLEALCICVGGPGQDDPACRACKWIVPARAAIASAKGETK